MSKALIILLFAAVLVSACSPGTPSGDSPVNSDTPVGNGPADYLPRPDDATLVRGQVFLDSTDLLTMESYPLQFSLSLKGSLPTPCSQLRVRVGRPDAGGTLLVDVYSVADPKTVCAQVLQPFEVTIPLGSFPGGHYRLVVNGKQVSEFDA